MSTGRIMIPMLGALLCAAALSACGQKGPLYLPDQTSEVVTRPTQTPTDTPSNTPAETSPAPETDKDKNKSGTAPPPK